MAEDRTCVPAAPDSAPASAIPEQFMYQSRADLYDRIYHFKNYAAEGARLRAVLAAAGVPDGSRVLEAACGTGNFLVQLSKYYQVEGFDLNEGVLGVARRKVPAVPVFRADMAEFAIERPVDAVVCLFSSFGYVAPGCIRSAAESFFRALRPGGVAFIECWITPEESIPNNPVLQTYDGTKAAVPEQMHVARAVTHLPDGRRSVFDFHWLVVTPQGVEHFTEHHELWQSTSEELLVHFRAVGFDATWLSPGPLFGRGSLLLRRP